MAAITWRNINIPTGNANPNAALAGINMARRSLSDAQESMQGLLNEQRKIDEQNFKQQIKNNDAEIRNNLQSIDSIGNWNKAAQEGIFNPKNLQQKYGAQFSEVSFKQALNDRKKELQDKTYNSVLSQGLKVAEQSANTEVGGAQIQKALLEQGASGDFALKARNKFLNDTQHLQSTFKRNKITKTVDDFQNIFKQTGDTNRAYQAITNSNLSGEDKIKVENTLRNWTDSYSKLGNKERSALEILKIKAGTEAKNKLMQIQQAIAGEKEQYRKDIGVTKEALSNVSTWEKENKDFVDSLVEKFTDISPFAEAVGAWTVDAGPDAKQALRKTMNKYESTYGVPRVAMKQILFSAVEKLQHKGYSDFGGKGIDTKLIDNEVNKLVQKYKNASKIQESISQKEKALPIMQANLLQDIQLNMLSAQEDMRTKKVKGELPKGTPADILTNLNYLTKMKKSGSFKSVDVIENKLKGVANNSNQRSSIPKNTYAQEQQDQEDNALIMSAFRDQLKGIN